MSEAEKGAAVEVTGTPHDRCAIWRVTDAAGAVIFVSRYTRGPRAGTPRMVGQGIPPAERAEMRAEAIEAAMAHGPGAVIESWRVGRKAKGVTWIEYGRVIKGSSS